MATVTYYVALAFKKAEDDDDRLEVAPHATTMAWHSP
jgi:hypothetical protein